jgi:hypothetical protein
MARSLGIVVLACLVVGGISACETARPYKVQPTATAFILMGASMRAWSRPGASEQDFKREARLCLDSSADDRTSSPTDQKAEAA